MSDTESKQHPAPSEANARPDSKITVAGVTFSANEVVSAVLRIDGRKVHIEEQEQEPRKIGFAK